MALHLIIDELVLLTPPKQLFQKQIPPESKNKPNYYQLASFYSFIHLEIRKMTKDHCRKLCSLTDVFYTLHMIFRTYKKKISRIIVLDLFICASCGVHLFGAVNLMATTGDGERERGRMFIIFFNSPNSFHIILHDGN